MKYNFQDQNDSLSNEANEVDEINANYYNHYMVGYCVKSEQRLQIGKLGEFFLPVGYYLYVGKDKRNIRARVARHIGRNKKNRWHIDYLSQHAMPIFMRMIYGIRSECFLIAKLRGLGGEPLIPGFGSSDCHCQSHLLYYQELPLRQLMTVETD